MADGEIITMPLARATFWRTAPVTPEQAALFAGLNVPNLSAFAAPPAAPAAPAQWHARQPTELSVTELRLLAILVVDSCGDEDHNGLRKWLGLVGTDAERISELGALWRPPPNKKANNPFGPSVCVPHMH